MINEKIVTMLNKKLWGQDIKILNFNEFDVFNVELTKPKMEFVFIVAIAAFFTAGMLYVVKSSDKKSKNNLKTA